MSRPHATYRTSIYVLLATAVTAGCISCATSSNDTKSATAGLPNVLQDLTDHQWLLDRATTTPNIEGTNPVTLTFSSDHTLSGTSPCNQYFGSFTLSEDTIKIGPLRQTLKACEEPNNTAEHVYTTALEAVHTVASTSQDHLKLKGDNGISLAFQAK